MTDFLAAILKPTATQTDTTVGKRASDLSNQSLKEQLGYVNPNSDPNNPFAAANQTPVTASDVAGMGVRAVGQGLGDLANFAEEAAINYALPTALQGAKDLIPRLDYTKASDKLSNALDLAKPVTPNEQLASSGIRGAVSFAVPMGEAKLPEMALNAAAGLASGTAQEAVKQAGGDENAQTATGLIVGASGLITGHMIASRFGNNVAKAVENTPLTEVFDDQGNLTQTGQEVAAKAKTTPDVLKQAYEESLANTQQHYDNVKQAVDQGLQAGLPENDPYIQKGQQVLKQIDDARAQVDQKLNAPENYESPINPQTTTPEQRIQDSQDLSVPLTSGQISNDFTEIGKERALIRNEGDLGTQARDIYQNQQDALNQAASNMGSNVSEGSMPKADQGAIIQNALSKLKNDSYTNVVQLYKDLENLPNPPKVDKNDFMNQAFDVLDQFPEGDNRGQQLLKILGKYDAIPPEYIEQKTYDPIFKETTVGLRNGASVKFRGEPVDLTVSNAEKLNQALNGLYKQGEPNPQFPLKSVLHDEVVKTLDNTASQTGQTGNLGKIARQAYQEHINKFVNGKDNIIAKLAEKDDTGNFVVSPDRVMDLITGPKDNINNLRKLKTILLSKPESKDAWDVISKYSLGKILDESLDTNGNLSATKLQSRLHKIGNAKLKILFNASEFNDLMKLNRLAQYTSSTGVGSNSPVRSHLFNLIYHAAKWGSLGFGHGATHAASIAWFGMEGLLKSSKEAKEAQATLAAMKDYKANPSEAKLNKPELSPERLKLTLDFLTSKEFINPLLQGTMSKRQRNEDNK